MTDVLSFQKINHQNKIQFYITSMNIEHDDHEKSYDWRGTARMGLLDKKGNFDFDTMKNLEFSRRFFGEHNRDYYTLTSNGFQINRDTEFYGIIHESLDAIAVNFNIIVDCSRKTIYGYKNNSFLIK